MSDRRITHTTSSLVLSGRLGAHGLTVLHGLLWRARECEGQLAVQATCRSLANELGLSTATVNRRLTKLGQLGIIKRRGLKPEPGKFVASSFTIHLDQTGIELTG